MSKNFISPDSSRYLMEINTAGSVDNGKSTLIGRLLYDSGGLPLDRIEQIRQKSRSKNNPSGDLNLAFFTDGLRAESEQGITIDVARHFVSRGRLDLIVNDTPGHEEYTRNTVTGTSNSQLTLILVDATKGIVEQNRRHAYIASLLGVPNIAILVNKMDLVGYSQEKFQTLKNEFDQIISRLNIKNPYYIPISALDGDNVVKQSRQMSWYDGPPLLSLIEDLAPKQHTVLNDFRFVVQWISNQSAGEEPILYGHSTGKKVNVGDFVIANSASTISKVQFLEGFDGNLSETTFPSFTKLQLQNSYNISRGEIITKRTNPLPIATEVVAEVCWMMDEQLKPNQEILAQVNGRVVKAHVEEILSEVDLLSYQAVSSKGYLQRNDLAKLRISFAEPIVWERGDDQASKGRFILIDPETKTTSGAGVVIKLKKFENS